jgi:mannosyltransferase OCH1-like enzyme
MVSDLKLYTAPRENTFVVKNYDITVFSHLHNDIFMFVAHYITSTKIQITTRRIDEPLGWGQDLKCIFKINNSNNSAQLTIGQSDHNEKIKIFDLDFEVEKAEHEKAQMIPNIIIQTFPHSNLSMLRYNTVKNNLDLNPDYEYYFFTDEDCEKFIKDYFPDNVFVAYHKLVSGAYQADLFRLCALFHFGGFYLDCKMILVKSLNYFKKYNRDNILCSCHYRPGYYNAFMGFSKQNPVVKECIDLMVENILSDKFQTYQGPMSLGHVCKKMSVDYILDEKTTYQNYENYMFDINNNEKIAHQRFPNCYSQSDITNYTYYKHNDNQGLMYKYKICDNLYLATFKQDELINKIDKVTIQSNSDSYKIIIIDASVLPRDNHKKNHKNIEFIFFNQRNITQKHVIVPWSPTNKYRLELPAYLSLY